MTSPGYLSDAAAGAKAVSGFEEAAASLKAAMAQMESTLRDTLARYQGDQAVAFWDVSGRIQEDMTVAGSELNTMAGLVGKSFSNYAGGDAQAAASLRTVGSNLGSGAGGQVFNRLNGV